MNKDEETIVKEFVNEIRSSLIQADSSLNIASGYSVPYASFYRFLDEKAPSVRKYQTDILVFETYQEKQIPRVIVECKIRLNTDDIIAYNEKARKHKNIFPHLQYGFLLFDNDKEELPWKYHINNSHFDFELLLPIANITDKQKQLFIDTIIEQVKLSREKERIIFELK